MLRQCHEDFAKAGYLLLPAVFTTSEMSAACQAVAAALAAPSAADSLIATKDGRTHGARNLLHLWPGVADLIRASSLAEELKQMLGPAAGIVRGLFFDKPPGDTWALPWHRDTTVAVRSHGVIGQFRKPTVKAGVRHMEAPEHLLATMVTVRIHLDAMTEANGPLRVVPGSHLLGDVTPRDDQSAGTLTCGMGDVLLMRPLLLHASGHCAAEHDGHRRIVHLELASTESLADGYAWHTFLPLHAC
jgi:hypothetical protein